MIFRNVLNSDFIYSFEETILTGFAENGGIIMPNDFPTISQKLNDWGSFSYCDVVKNICKEFITNEDIPMDCLDDIIGDAYNSFTHNEVAPLTPLDDFDVLELYHGPTWSFKDYAMVSVSQFINYFMKKRKSSAKIIVVTSGDTGSSALESVRNVQNTFIYILFPRDRCSEVQELQLTTANVTNSLVIRAKGTSDSLDTHLMKLAEDKTFSQRHNLTSINSINFGRILMQIAHHVYSYLKVSKNGEPIDIIIPSGALGNITSACIAHAMGVPIRLVLCCNANDIAHRMVQTGVVEYSDKVHKSHSCAMDIDMPYNISRLLWIFSNKDYSRVNELMASLRKDRKLVIPKDIHDRMRSVIIDSISVNDELSLATMKKCYERYGYIVCPHTACAVAYCFNKKSDEGYRRVVIATASPHKFSVSCRAAGVELPTNEAVKELYSKPKVFLDFPDNCDLTNYIKTHMENVSVS